MPKALETLITQWNLGKWGLPKSSSKSESTSENSDPGCKPRFTFHLQSKITQECQKFNRAFSSNNLVLERVWDSQWWNFPLIYSFIFHLPLPSSVSWLLSVTAVQITGLFFFLGKRHIYYSSIEGSLKEIQHRHSCIFQTEIFKAAFSSQESREKTLSIIYVSTNFVAYQSM